MSVCLIVIKKVLLWGKGGKIFKSKIYLMLKGWWGTLLIEDNINNERMTNFSFKISRRTTDLRRRRWWWRGIYSWGWHSFFRGLVPPFHHLRTHTEESGWWLMRSLINFKICADISNSMKDHPHRRKERGQEHTNLKILCVVEVWKVICWIL